MERARERRHVLSFSKFARKGDLNLARAANFPRSRSGRPDLRRAATSDLGTDPLGTMTDTIHLKVAMMCTGCSGAVERVLGKMEGVTSFDVNLETQKVTVVGTVTLDEVMAKIAKTGKAVEPWSD